MLLIALLLVPVATAVLAALSRRRPLMEAVNLAGFALTFLLALALGAAVLGSGPVSLWDGFLYADSLSALVILLTAFVAVLCSVYAVGYLRDDQRSGALGDDAAITKLRKYYTLTPLFVFSMLLVCLANNQIGRAHV